MSKLKGEIRATASAGAIALVDGAPPRRITLLNMGANARRDGQKPAYIVADRAHAEAIVAASNAYHGSTDPMIDYDHQSVFGAKDGVGGQAPAAGWMTRLVADDDGVHADVEWTGTASQELIDRRYRYISPYFGHQKDGRVTRIFNAALTNRPELELKAVASQSGDDPDDTATGGTNLSKDLIAALGLAEGATDADILAAVTTLATTSTAVCSALGLAAGASKEAIAVKIGEIRTAASAGAVDPKLFVPRSEFDALKGRVDADDEKRATASVNDAIANGKVTPAARDWALGYAKSDPKGFAAFIGVTPAVVEGGAEERRAAAVKDGTLTAEEKAVCSQMGMTEEDFIKSRKELEARQ